MTKHLVRKEYFTLRDRHVSLAMTPNGPMRASGPTFFLEWAAYNRCRDHSVCRVWRMTYLHIPSIFLQSAAFEFYFCYLIEQKL